MKKTLLLLVAGAFSMSANAQYASSLQAAKSSSNQTTQSAPRKITKAKNTSNPVASNTAAGRSADRTTSTCTYTETFGTGTYTTMPTGWTAGIISGPGTWHWANTASSTMYSIGAIASTTASNGWMIFDSDSLAGGTGTGTIVPSGWLQSPAYNCSGLTTVRLTFQEYFEEFQDSCFIEVSTSPTFTTFTTYAVEPNNTLSDNSFTANPDTVHINITSAAAGNSAVYIRFVYDGPPAGGYSWMIDDICIGPLDTHDAGLSGSFVFEPNCTTAAGAYDGSMFNTPLAFVDSIFPVTLLTNYGSNTETSVPLTANIYSYTTSPSAGTLVYTPAAITYPSLVENSFDSVAQFGGYLPTAIGSYFCAMNVNLTGDEEAYNNTDTVSFNVTDTLWQENLGSVSLNGGYYIYSSSASPVLSLYQGTRFDVPCGATTTDTVSGFGVAFASSSLGTGTGKVSVQLYSTTKDATFWTYEGTSVALSLTAANYCTSSSLNWCDFRIDQSEGVSGFVLQPGTSYAAMVQINGVTSDLIICTTPAPNATGYSGYFGQSATSGNDGSTTFGSSTIATGSTSYVPMIRMYTGPVPISHVGVQNVTNDNSIGQPFPNPSTTSFTIPMTMAQDTKVTVTLMDITGQAINTQVVNAIGGQSTAVVFNTTGLVAGMYMYTVLANGVNTTGRVVVSH